MGIVVIGKNGQLAKELVSLGSKTPLVCFGRSEINLFDFDSLAAKLDKTKASSIINAAAYTEVDRAESNKTEAFSVNHLGVANLAKYAQSRNIHLVHVSTDYVFSGDKGSPYKTTDDYSPISVYGGSKAAGERELLNVAEKHSCIIRTSWVYSNYGKNFVKTMLRLMREKSSLNVIDDQIGSPTSARTLAKICYHASKHKVLGVHHFTDAGVASWYDFAVAIQEIGLKLGILTNAVEIVPIPTSAYPTKACRPSYSILDKSSLASDFNGLQPRHWRTELEDTMAQFSSQQ